VATVVFGDCEWDDGKAAENLAKHGVSFQEAATALADVDMRVFDDGSGAGRVVAHRFLGGRTRPRGRPRRARGA